MTDAPWRDHVARHPNATFADLVDGLDLVAEQPIPFARLPKRTRTVYPEFDTWSDLAGETIPSLLTRPKAGVALVRAIVEAATAAVVMTRSVADGDLDAASAARGLLDRLPDRDRILLATRVWAPWPQTPEQVARRLGIHSSSVHRSLRRAKIRFADLLADPLHRDVVVHAERLRHDLGILTRQPTAELVLARLGLKSGSEAGDLLLHVAGPYGWRDDWLEDRSRDGMQTATRAVADTVACRHAPTLDELTRALTLVGMAPHAVADFVACRPGLRHVDGRWVLWGRTTADHVEAGLHLLGTPASAESIAATIDDDRRPEAVREALYADHRFIRTTRRNWALTEWGLAEYAGLYGEITARIDAAGGSIDVEGLLRDVAGAFPDVSPSSIRTFLNAPGLIREDGRVRRRTEDDGWPPVPPLHRARGVFRKGRDVIRVAIVVDGELLRGAGRTIQASVATALAVHPGDRRTFTTSPGDLVLQWRLSATNGASLGSLRPIAVDTGADLGDTLVLAFDLARGSVGTTRIPSNLDPSRHLPLLLGKPVTDPLTALARALRCRPADVASLLRRRGEEHLLGLEDRQP